MCFPFGTDIDVDGIASKVGTLFVLDTTAEVEEILIQNDVQIKSRASTDIKGEFWHLISDKGYVPFACHPYLDEPNLCV